jgi:hypothetical protein
MNEVIVHFHSIERMRQLEAEPVYWVTHQFRLMPRAIDFHFVQIGTMKMKVTPNGLHFNPFLNLCDCILPTQHSHITQVLNIVAT